MPILLENLRSPPAFSGVCCCSINTFLDSRSLFVLLSCLTILFSVLLQFTTSDYLFGIVFRLTKEIYLSDSYLTPRIPLSAISLREHIDEMMMKTV